MLGLPRLLGLVLTLSIAPTFTATAAEENGAVGSESISIPGAAPQSITTHVDHHPDPIVIDGKVYGENEGLTKVVVTGVIPADGSHSAITPSGALTPLGWAPYYNTTISWGSSWVRNQEIGYLLYRGSTQAGGNVYEGQRIIQTTLKYKRNGNIIGSATSNAIYQSNRWNAGSVAYTKTWDSPKPNVPETQFYYSYYSVNPNITG